MLNPRNVYPLPTLVSLTPTIQIRNPSFLSLFTSISSLRRQLQLHCFTAKFSPTRPLRDSATALDDVVGVSPEDVLPAPLRRELMPRHVAVIMDGNRRWARMRGLPAPLGYEAGLRAVRLVVDLCCRWGIQVLTVFAFSSDNWLRPKVEVDFLMTLFQKGLREEVNNFIRDGIRISVIGDSSNLPKSLLKLISETEEKTKNNSRLHLIIAVSYTGQNDIVQACRSIALKVKDGLVEPEDINENLFEQELETNCTEIPHPDLLIRTSGELRVSNFFLWQLAYTELFFAKSYWPDFGEDEFLEALLSFQQRHRRFGRSHAG